MDKQKNIPIAQVNLEVVQIPLYAYYYFRFSWQSDSQTLWFICMYIPYTYVSVYISVWEYSMLSLTFALDVSA